MSPSRPWMQLAGVALSAILTVMAADVLLGGVAPPLYPEEAEDGIARFEAGDPETLVLGSSHGRTFKALGEVLRERTGGARELVAIPVEHGRLTAYQWVLEHRLRPLVEEQDASGRRVRARLSRFILVTEWWDTTATDDPPWNLPSRAWHLEDYLRDLRGRGMTDFNRNYVQTRWRRLWRRSTLAQHRGTANTIRGLRAAVLGPPEKDPDALEDQLESWRLMIESGRRMLDPTEMQAFRGMLAYFREQGIDTTVLLFPRKPATLTAKSKATTLRRFAGEAARVAAESGARFIDLTDRSPLRDDEFMADFDHVTASGNRRFANWVLEHDLAFLLDPPPAPQPPRGGGR